MISTGKADTFLEKIHRFLIQQRVLAGSRIGIGLSGGADSVSLTLALVELNSHWNFTMFGCYLDHGIRPESENTADGEFIKSLCRRLDIRVYTEKAGDGAIIQRCRQEKRSVEEVAREVRYSFYTRAVENNSLDFIALGHTMDDHAETMVMRIFMGSNASGLGGIPPRRGCFIRPLYLCRRTDVIDFLTARGERWREDSSNLDNLFLRNRIRRELLPIIEDIFPGYRSGLTRLSEKMRSIEKMLEQEMTVSLPWKKIGTSVQLNLAEYVAAPEAVRLYTLYRMFNTCNPQLSRRIPYTFLKPALSYRETDTHLQLLRGFGCVLSRRGETLFLERDVVLKRKKGYFIVVEIGTDYPIADNMSIIIERGRYGAFQSTGVYEEEVKPPLIVRSRYPGDAIQLQSGRKSLKKLFNEWKIRELERYCIPVVEDRTGVVAVLGEAFGGKDRVRNKGNAATPDKEKSVLFFRVEKGIVDTIDVR